MTSHLDSHTTTDIKLDILSDVKPEMEFHMYNIRGIAHAHTNRKNDIFMVYHQTEQHSFDLEENRCGTLTWFQCLASKEKILSSVQHT